MALEKSFEWEQEASDGPTNIHALVIGMFQLLALTAKTMHYNKAFSAAKALLKRYNLESLLYLHYSNTNQFYLRVLCVF